MSDVEFLSEPYAAPVRRKRPSRWVIPVAAALVVGGGAAGSYYAMSDSRAGSDTATEAVQAMVGDIEHSDLIGILDDLAPGERLALEPGLRSDIASLQRLGVLSKNADPHSISGITITGSNLKFVAGTRVNAHVQIVDVTGGTLTMRGDPAKLPLGAKIVKMMRPMPKAQTQTVSLARHPLHIAAEEVDGRWYASLGYTIANGAAHGRVPSAASAITPDGTTQPADAVKVLVTKLLAGDVRSALAVLSPAELGAVQTYAGMFLQHVPPISKTGVRLENLKFTTKSVGDGYQRVTLTAATVRTPSGRMTFARQGSCFVETVRGKTQRLCADRIAPLMDRAFGAVQCAGNAGRGTVLSGGNGSHGTFSYRPLPQHGMSYGSCGGPARMRLTPAQKVAITHLFAGLTDAGIDVQSVAGSWYVAPVRSMSDAISSVLSHLQGNDLWALASLGR